MRSLAPPFVYVLLAVTSVAAVMDLRVRRIPNWLTLPALATGITMQVVLQGSPGLWVALAGTGVALLVYLPLFAIRAQGAGDVKLMAAVGSFTGAQHWLLLFVLVSLFGGAFAVVLIALRGASHPVLNNIRFLLSELLQGRMPYRGRSELDIRHPAALTLPHALSIWAGTCLFLYGF